MNFNGFLYHIPAQSLKVHLDQVIPHLGIYLDINYKVKLLMLDFFFVL